MLIVVAGKVIVRKRAGVLVGVLAAGLTLLFMAGCDDPPGPAELAASTDPLLYEIAAADGSTQGWMLGTIHALSDGTYWRTPNIERAVDAADLLVVEIAGLDDNTAVADTFGKLSTTRGLPELSQRLPPQLAASLAALLERGGLEPSQFVAVETWAAAIRLSQIDATGDPANGVDRALIRDFAHRPVHEFEGTRIQLAIFDRLSEAQQRAMLAAVVREADRVREDPERLQRAWLAGNAKIIEQSTHTGMLADPSLREPLLLARNRRWATALVPILDQAPLPLIAVGTAHLLGPEGLIALIEDKGYRVRRLSRHQTGDPKQVAFRVTDP